MKGILVHASLGGSQAVASKVATSVGDKGKWNTGGLGQGSDGEHPTLTTFDWAHPLFGLSPTTSHQDKPNTSGCLLTCVGMD